MFVIAFERETQQAFVEAHVEAFRFFGDVFAVIRYDNVRSAVQRVLRGRRRVEQDRFDRRHFGSSVAADARRHGHLPSAVQL